jgi:hypothetical protein
MATQQSSVIIERVWSRLPEAPVLLGFGPDRSTLTEYPERTQGICYYRTAAFKIMAKTEGVELEIGGWWVCRMTAELIPDARERCSISCVALERLTGLMPQD